MSRNSVETRLQRLEARDRSVAPGRRLTISELDLVLASFPPSERILTDADRLEAERLIASCTTDLTDAELDAQLALFVDATAIDSQ